MKNILEELYWGNLQPETLCAEDTDLAPAQSAECEAQYKKFRSQLSEEAFHAYLEYEALQNKLNMDSPSMEARIFSHGFKLGALFMVEVFK